MSSRGGSRGRRKRGKKKPKITPEEIRELWREKEALKSLTVGSPEWVKARERIDALEKVWDRR